MSYQDPDPIPLWGYILILAFVLPLSIWGCPKPKQAMEVLRAEGYSSVVINARGGDGLSCSEDDNSATGFVAEHHGMRVHGVVCCGLIVKACTVHITESAPLAASKEAKTP